MKYFCSIVVAIAAVTVYADTPDLTGSLEFIANPQMDRWPNSALPRACLDLQFYQGRLFNGGGEVESNPGAPWIHSINPYDNTVRFEFDPGTEAIANYLITSWGDLVTPSQDPHEGDANQGHVFSRDAEGNWSVFRSVGGTLPAGSSTVANYTHCWDMAEFDGRVFVACYDLMSSTDHLQSFQKCSPIADSYHYIAYASKVTTNGTQRTYTYGSRSTLRRQIQLMKFGDVDLFAIGNTIVSPSLLENTNVNKQELYWYNPTTKEFVEKTQYIKTIYPGLKPSDYRLVGRNLSYLNSSEIASVWMRAWHTTTFKNRVLYVGCYDTPPYGSVSKPYEDSIALTSYPLPLMGCSASVNASHVISATRISFGGDDENYPWDYAVAGDAVYALTSRYVADGKKNHHIIWKSTDGVNFTEVLSFDFHQNFISLEYRDGWFYLGVGYKAATKGYTYDKTGDESGAIYRVWCPQEPVQVLASQSELTIPEGESRTVSFRLSQPPVSNLTLRVGATLENTRFTTDKSTLTFTVSNWSTPQDVTISLPDNDEIDTNRKGQVVCGVAGFDVERGEFCGPEATSGAVCLTIADSECQSPPAGEIYTADDFYRAMCFPDGEYRLMNDIDLEGSRYAPIDVFSGSLDGRGHALTGLGAGPLWKRNRGTLSNLVLDGRGTSVKVIEQGVLCHYFESGACTNVTIKGYTAESGAPEVVFGLFAARITGKAEFVNCSIGSDCVVKQTGANHDCSLGAFAGKLSCNTVPGTVAAFVNCTNNASMTVVGNYRSSSGAGGFIGMITDCASTGEPEILFEGCVNNGAITGSGDYNCIGGFVGRHNGVTSKTSTSVTRFRACQNNGSLSVPADKGKGGIAGGVIGVLGAAANGEFDGCINRCEMIAPKFTNVGGIVGRFGDYAANLGIGGIMIVNCANYADLSGLTNVGGLIGEASANSGYANGKFRFLNSANYGVLQGGEGTVGEIAGRIGSNATAPGVVVAFSNCWTSTSTLYGFTSKTPVEGDNLNPSVSDETAAAALAGVASTDDKYLSWAVGPTGHPELVVAEPSVPVEPPAMTYQFYHEALNVPALHAKGITGKGVRVGVVDDSIYPVIIGDKTNLTFAALAGATSSTKYHGTSVCSLIGSKKFGLAPDCEIWAYNSGNATGKTGLDQTIAGVWWCATNGCRVINMSFGFAPYMYDADLCAAFDAELAEIQRQTGVILINGNGNNPLSDINYCPQDSECVITIGGLKPDKTPAALTDSWRKDFCTFGDQVPDFVKPDGTIGTFDGTSCACPLATAIVALLLQQQPDLTQDEVYGILKSSAKVLAPGRTREYGWGLLQACEVPANYKRQAEYDAEKQAWVKLENITITNKFVTYTASDNFYEITMRTGSVIRLMLSDPMPANATDKTVYWYCGNNHAGRPILTDQILRAPDEIATVTEITIGGQTIKLPTPNLENVYSYQGMNANYELLFNLRVRLTTDPVEIPENENPNYVPADPERPERTDWSYYHESLNVPALHAKGITGKGVRVGIVDGPINEVTVDGEKNLTIARLAGSGHGNGHGLSVASIIASKKFGIAPDCELYAYDVGNSTASDQVNKVLKGLWWCATNGCKVINMSFSFNPFQPGVAELRESFDAEIKKICDQTGVILIASLGNNGLNDNPYFPQDTAYPICIGGITQDKQPTDLTKSWRHDFCAYGKQVPTFTKADGTVGNQDGTSFSAPMATGVAALLLQQVPTLTRDELYGILKGSAEVLAECRTREYGWGLVRACEVPSDYKRQSEYDAEKSAKVRLAGITINNQNGFYNPENGLFDMTVKVGKVVKIDYTPSPANATDKRAYWYAGNTQMLDPILADDVLRVRDDASLVGSFATYTAMNADYEELVKMRVFFTDQDVGPEPEEPEEPVDPPSGDPSVVYVATTGSDSASGAFDAPLLTISNAVARLGSVGGTVMVGPGEYKIYDPIVITAPVAVVGSGCGNEGTVVKNIGTYNYNTHANCRVMEVSNAVAMVQGLVMENGYVGMGSGMNHGGGVMLTSGTVSNCVIRGCTARQGSTAMPYGGGAYVFGAQSLLTHCVISNCISHFDANWGSVCGSGVHVDGGKVSNVLVVDCHGDIAEPEFAKIVGGIMLTDGTAENCTVVNCWGSKAGGICASPAKNKTVSVVNCVAFGCEKKLKDAEKVLQTTSSNGDGTESCFLNCSFAATAAAFADYANGDYRPAAGGVLVDAGAAIAAAPAGDLDGRPRVVGTAIDIGCFEWQEGGAVELETPVLSGSSFGFSGTGKFSIAVENPVRGAYYTVFTTEDLLGTFVAESASVLCDGEALVLEMDASAPQKFAKVVISSSPFVKGSELP